MESLRKCVHGNAPILVEYTTKPTTYQVYTAECKCSTVRYTRAEDAAYYWNHNGDEEEMQKYRHCIKLVRDGMAKHMSDEDRDFIANALYRQMMSLEIEDTGGRR